MFCYYTTLYFGLWECVATKLIIWKSIYFYLYKDWFSFRSSCLKNVIHKTSLICLKIVLLFGHQPILSGFNYKLYKDSVIYCFIEQLLFGLPWWIRWWCWWMVSLNVTVLLNSPQHTSMYLFSHIVFFTSVAHTESLIVNSLSR